MSIRADPLLLSGTQKIVKKRLDIKNEENIIQVCLGPCPGAKRRPGSLNVLTGTGMAGRRRRRIR